MKDGQNFHKMLKGKLDAKAAERGDSDKKKLLTIVNKKISTTAVGAIASAEKHFGFLWGHKEYRELTEEEKFAKDKFDEFRKEIFDNMNKQVRNTEEEFKIYTIVCNGYSLQLPVYKGGK